MCKMARIHIWDENSSEYAGLRGPPLCMQQRAPLRYICVYMCAVARIHMQDENSSVYAEFRGAPLGMQQRRPSYMYVYIRVTSLIHICVYTCGIPHTCTCVFV